MGNLYNYLVSWKRKPYWYKNVLGARFCTVGIQTPYMLLRLLLVTHTNGTLFESYRLKSLALI